MKKKFIALAIAGVVVPPYVMADEGAITLYGKLNVGVEQVKAEGCNSAPVADAAGTTFGAACTGSGDVKRRTRVTDSFSYIGVRGVEPLGGGLSAFFQVESLVKADNGTGGNQTVGTANSNVFASRNSGVGLRGGFGEVLLGRWDLYYTEHIPAGDTTFMKGPLVATALAILGSQNGLGGLSFDSLSAAGLTGPVQTLNIAQGPGPVDLGGRRNDQLRYQSPKWGDFLFRVSYVAPELRRDYTNAFGSFSAKNDGFGATLLFQNTRFFANYSYYQRNDVGFAVAYAGNDSTAHKLSLGTALGNFKLGAIAERVTHEAKLDALGLAPAATVGGGTTNTIDRERDAYVLFAAYGQGPWLVGATYGMAREVEDNDGSCGAVCDNTDAKYFQITGLWNFSKRTNLYLTLAKIRNEENASYDFFNQGAISDTNLISRGADPQSISLGINHFF